MRRSSSRRNVPGRERPPPERTFCNDNPSSWSSSWAASQQLPISLNQPVSTVGFSPLEFRNGMMLPTDGTPFKSQWMASDGHYMGSSSENRGSYARTWKAQDQRPIRTAGAVDVTPTDSCFAELSGRAATAETRVGRRGQHRNSYGSFYHKKQEKVMGYGAHISPDQEKQFRLLTRYRDEGTPKLDLPEQMEISRHSRSRAVYGGYNASYSLDGVRSETGTRCGLSKEGQSRRGRC